MGGAPPSRLKRAHMYNWKDERIQIPRVSKRQWAQSTPAFWSMFSEGGSWHVTLMKKSLMIPVTLLPR